MSTTATFTRERLIRFSDCDPAGIVFYPQYFVMFNGLVEDWVEEGLGIGYRRLVIDRRIGLPTVRLEADFRAVSRMGDRVALTLEVERLGGKSLSLALRCNNGADDELRMQMKQVIVTTSLDTHQAIAIPPDLRAAIEGSAVRLLGFHERKNDMNMQVLLPEGWPRPKGYANGVAVTGRQVYVAGMIGWDAQCVFHTDDFAEQTRQALQNIVDTLAVAGAKPEHIVRMTWYVVDKREYLAAGKDIGKIYREVIGAYNAVMTAVEVKALIEDRARVEIEVTAVIPA
jgi:acyl-CoA thioesterase FadM/enamine deaminase RidA (YjgF/YER057c/UK114 family)